MQTEATLYFLASSIPSLSVRSSMVGCSSEWSIILAISSLLIAFICIIYHKNYLHVFFCGLECYKGLLLSIQHINQVRGEEIAILLLWAHDGVPAFPRFSFTIKIVEIDHRIVPGTIGQLNASTGSVDP